MKRELTVLILQILGLDLEGQIMKFTLLFFLVFSLDLQAQNVQKDIVDPQTQIGILSDYPAIPQNFGMADFRNIASYYDTIVFNRRPSPLRPLGIALVGNGVNPLVNALFNIESFQLKPFVLSTDTNPIGQSVASFPAIVSSSLIGRDMSATLVNGESNARNLVRMIKRNFHGSAGMFGNYPDGYGGLGNSFWYDLMPNIYAMQINSLYGPLAAEKGSFAGETSLDSLNYQMIDLMYLMSDYLRTVPGGTATRPNFNVKAVKVLNRSPLQLSAVMNDPYPEPDAAAGMAILGLMAYNRWGAVHHLTLAQWGLNFLETYSGNPYYEHLMPYGALAAARMNSEYNFDYRLDKALQNCFSVSNVRQDHGTLSSSSKAGVGGGLWGGYPVDGLWGPRGVNSSYYNGMGHYKNTILQAVTLAPIARYNTSYARALGRYMQNVTSNSKIFFPQYLPRSTYYQDAQTFNYIYSNDQSLRYSVPYESIRHEHVDSSGVKHTPYAKGDAVQYGWANTDLSYYSGAETGYLGSILASTQDPYIYMWDLLKTDFNHPKAFPTFLIYNPLNSNRSIIIDMDKIRVEYGAQFNINNVYHLYDAVSDTWVGSGLTTRRPTITISAGNSMVLVVVPAGANPAIVNGKHVDKVTGTVIDYHYPSPTRFNSNGNPIR